MLCNDVLLQLYVSHRIVQSVSLSPTVFVSFSNTAAIVYLDSVFLYYKLDIDDGADLPDTKKKLGRDSVLNILCCVDRYYIIHLI